MSPVLQNVPSATSMYPSWWASNRIGTAGPSEPHRAAEPCARSDTAAMAQGGKLFFVTALGEEGSPTRERTTDIQRYVVEPAARRVGLEVERGDLDPAPGRIMEQVLDALLGARVVVCDLTGDNPNVYYE